MTNPIFALVLAGGSGSRLWPLSRELYPKQLLKIVGDNSLFSSTFLRLVDNIDDKNILTVSNVKLEPHVKIELENLKKQFCREKNYHVITEPVGKNTAPAIALGVEYIKNFYCKKQDPIIVVCPSDHLILNNNEFTKQLNKSIELAKENYIVTLGITPTKADTGFGYIKTVTNKKIKDIVKTALKVQEFVEKPNLKTAEKFIEEKSYYWNAGIFVFKASVFKKELKKYSKEILDILEKSELSKKMPTIPYMDFEKMPDISIDYALMEKSAKIALIPLDCGWNDLGSWEAIYEISEKDKQNNAFVGNVMDIGSKNSLIYSTSKLITTIGLKNTVVVETEDAILVCNKEKTSDVKKIYEKLKNKKDNRHLVHKTVYRPWGYYTVMQQGKGFLTKCICVNPLAKLSLQLHNHRSEHWVVLEGTALVTKGENEIELNVGESIDLASKELHSLSNVSDVPLKILEVQQGEILDENDIVRLKDIYGRV